MERRIMELVLVNGKIFFEGKLIEAHIGVSEGKVLEIKKIPLKGEKKIDCRGKIVFPGIIDAHVHFREPGGEKKEDWKTGSKAAAAGGITTVLDMPNNSPPITTKKLLEEKMELARKKSVVNFGLFLGATNENFTEIESCPAASGIKLYMGSSTGGMQVKEKEAQENVFGAAKKAGKVLAVHAEDEARIKENEKKFRNRDSPEIHSKIRDEISAEKAVKSALEMQKLSHNRLHVCHISTEKELSLLKNSPATREVTVNHLFFCTEDYASKKNFLKVNPPVRSKRNVAALWNALNAGEIDLIVTDHAPHLPEEKEQDYWFAPSGIPGVETLLAVMLDAANKKRVSLERVMECMCVNPAKVYSLNSKGLIRKGFDADLTVVDLKKEWKVKGEGLLTKCGWSPFEGMTLKGKAVETVVEGKTVLD